MSAYSGTSSLGLSWYTVTDHISDASVKKPRIMCCNAVAVYLERPLDTPTKYKPIKLIIYTN